MALFLTETEEAKLRGRAQRVDRRVQQEDWEWKTRRKRTIVTRTGTFWPNCLVYVWRRWATRLDGASIRRNPIGQISYHIPLMDALLTFANETPPIWDGHTTPEKWGRIREYLKAFSEDSAWIKLHGHHGR